VVHHDPCCSVYPEGLFHILRSFATRYPSTPLFITENGVADEADIIRHAYLVEHLLAIKAAMETGVRVLGYVFWTISDNWEWADGFCPKFGLAAVNRSDPNMRRVPRESYDLFTEIATSRAITAAQRSEAWRRVSRAASRGGTRPFCRAKDGKGSLDTPVQRALSKRDWRFGHRKDSRASAKARRRLEEVQIAWRNATKELEASWAGAAKEAAEAWTAWYEEGWEFHSSTATEAAKDELFKKVQGWMRQGLFNISSFDVPQFVKTQLEEAHVAVEDWRADLQLANRLAPRSQDWRGAWKPVAVRARAKLRAWWTGSRKDEI